MAQCSNNASTLPRPDPPSAWVTRLAGQADVRTFHYASIGDLADWLALGWLPHAALDGTPHSAYSVLVEWICICPPIRPTSRP